MLFMREDGTYEALCFSHKQEREKEHEEARTKLYERLAITEQCFHIPWRDVVKITLHKPKPDGHDRLGPVITIEMKDVPNRDLMREHALEVAHGLQLMADKRATIHRWTEGTEQNDCWTDTNYFWEHPTTCTVRDKYWGRDRIKRFHKICRTMAEIHEWEIEDETVELLDRIAQALEDEN